MKWAKPLPSCLLLPILVLPFVNSDQKERTTAESFVKPCGVRATTTNGTIVSPLFPKPYPNDVDCIYEFVRPNKNYCGIKFIVDFLSLDNTDGNEWCIEDFIEIMSCVPPATSRFCGNDTGSIYQFLYQSDATSLLLRFHSDGVTKGGEGFKIRYQNLEECQGPYIAPPVSLIPDSNNQPCYTKISDFKGTIYTPHYPKAYPADMDCVYEFVRPNSEICGVLFKSLTFDLAPSLMTPIGLEACSDFFHMPSCGFMCGKSEFLWLARYQPGATSLLFHFHSEEESDSLGPAGFYLAFSQLKTCNSSIQEFFN